MTKTIEITIEKNGNITMEANGFVGESCKNATEALEKALGTTEKVVEKAEYFQDAQATIQVKNKG